MNFGDMFEVAAITTSAILLSFGLLFLAFVVRRQRFDSGISNKDVFTIAPVRKTMRLMLAAIAVSVAGMSAYSSVPLYIFETATFNAVLTGMLVAVILIEAWAFGHLIFGDSGELLAVDPGTEESGPSNEALPQEV